MKFTIDEFLQQLPKPATPKWVDGVWDVEAHSKNGVKLVFFAPRGVDRQTSHEEDEYYFIARGLGTIVIGEESFACAAGDALFVPAGMEPRFDNFTEDFATWAIFF